MWNSIYLSDDIKAYPCGNSLRVCMPEGSDYEGYSFFHPLKLVNGEYGLSLVYNDDWVFRLAKRKKVGGEWQTVSTAELTPEELKDAIGDIPLLHKPPKLDPLENVEPLEELLDE